MSEFVPATGALLRVTALWRRRAPGLAIGIAASLLAFLFLLTLLATSGLRLAGTGAGLLLGSALLLRVLGLGRVALRYAERLLTHDAMFRALADLRVWFFRRLAVSAAGGLGHRRSGDLLSRLVGDVEALDGLYLRIAVPLAGALLALPLLVVLAARHGSALALLIGAAFASAVLLLPLAAASLVSRDASALSGRSAALRVAVLDLIGGLREIRAFGAEGRMLAGVQAQEAALLQLQLRLARRTAIAGALSFLCQQAAVLAVLAAAAGLVFGRLGALDAVVLLFVLIAAFEGSGGLTRAGALAGHIGHAARRVVEVGAAGNGVSVPSRPRNDAVPGDNALRFRDVGFRWQLDRPPVFEHLSLEIPSGARVAVLGPSGCGKSTLAALLLRVAAPQQGAVTLGGVDLAELDEAVLRRRFAWLSQSTHLFEDTVRANLLLGRPDATDAQLWQALDQAVVGDVVRALPDGLDGWLGENGAGLSGGQARRVALARTLLSPAPILILDEPGAGLDALTEQNFLSTLNDVAAGRTVVLIAHRLTGVERLDRIWRLSGGHATAAAA